MFIPQPQQQHSQQQLEELYNVMNKYSLTLNQCALKGKEITQQCNAKLHYSMKEVDSQINTNRLNKTLNASRLGSGQFYNASLDIEDIIEQSLLEIEVGNNAILERILQVQRNMELVCQADNQLNRNTAMNLAILRDIEQLKYKMEMLHKTMDGHDLTLRFEEPEEEIDGIMKIEDFEEQSVEVLQQLKADYIRTKLILDRNNFVLAAMQEAVDKKTESAEKLIQ